MMRINLNKFQNNSENDMVRRQNLDKNNDTDE